MSNQQQYPNHPPFEGGPQFQPPAPKKHTVRNVVIGAVVGIFAVVAGCTAIVGGALSSVETKAPVSVTSKAGTVKATTQPAPTETTIAPVAPTAGDFTLTPKTLSKECFGSAGCILTYTIVISYTGPELGAGDSYTVIYDVRGGQDGTVTNTFTIEGDSSTVDSSEVIQTKSSKSKLTAVVTDVMES